MTKESLYGVSKDGSVFRETFNSEVDTVKNGGTPTDISYANGVATFNGTTSKVDTGTDSIGTKAVTIVARIYPTGWGEGNANARIISNEKTEFIIYSAANPSLRFWSDGGSIKDSGEDLVLNKWQHVVVTRNAAGDETNFYINGVLSGAANQDSGTPTAGTTNVIIGNRAAGDRTFDGDIDYVRIIDEVWTAKDALLDFQGQLFTDNREGLVGEWNLDRDSGRGTTVGDTSGQGNNGTSANTPVYVKDQLGRAGKSVDFDGADTTIPTTWTSNTEFQNGFTISAWINPNSDGESSAGRIIDKSENIFSTNGFGFFTYQNKLNFQVDRVLKQSGAFSYDGVWKHALITVTSAGTINFYIDGVLSGYADQSTTALTNIRTANPLTIGNRSEATDRTFDGSISDVRIYNRILSQTEITQMYQRQFGRVGGH